MKLLDKLKNALFEEEYVEVEEKKEKKKEKPIAKKIVLENSKPKKEVKKEDVIVEETPKEKEESPNKDFKFKAILEDDFIDLEDKHKEKPKKKEPTREEFKEEIKKEPLYPDKKKKEKDLYKGAYNIEDNPFKAKEHSGLYEKPKEKKEFKPSPIISPIYGVLDQNYSKDDVVAKKEIRITSSYKPHDLDVDSVRKKAYGNSDDIFDEELTSNKKEKDSKEEVVEETTSITEEDSLLDISANNTPSVEKVTMGDAEEYFQDLGLEYNVDYKDISHEKATGRRSDMKKDDDYQNVDNTALEDNLFDLIDSMYDEKKGE